MNNKNRLLINIVADVLPNGEYGWQTVALAYQEQLKDAQLHRYEEALDQSPLQWDEEADGPDGGGRQPDTLVHGN